MAENIVGRISANNSCDPAAYSAKKLLNSGSVIIYGAGEGYFAVKRTILNPYNLTPSLIVDIKFDGTSSFDGLSAINLSQFEGVSADYLNAVVIVTVGSKNVFFKVRDELLRMGVRQVLWTPDLYEYSIHHYDPAYLREGLSYFRDRADEIERAFGLLADVVSRQVFEAILKRYMTGEPDEIPSHSYDQQYVPQDVPLLKGATDYLCCGAYDGDSIKKIHGTRGRMNKVVAFEPDPLNYKKLTTYLKENSGNVAETVCAFPCGVYSENQQIRFAGDNGLSSTISEDGDQFINVVSLDDALAGTKFTYVTMDVEGAEFSALEGAREMIMRFAPDMAISVYHAPQDLWRIINHLDLLGCGYQFYLRNYTGFTYETVLYVVGGHGQ